jgi:hypothetical protein
VSNDEAQLVRVADNRSGGGAVAVTANNTTMDGLSGQTRMSEGIGAKPDTPDFLSTILVQLECPGSVFQ